MDLACLPWNDVVFCKILPNLNALEILNLRTVSREWYHMIYSYFQSANCLDLSEKLLRPTPITSKDAILITSITTTLRIVRLPKAINWLKDEMLENIVASNLTDLDLSRNSQLSNAVLITIGNRCKKLVSLNLSHCHWVAVEALQHITENNNHLTELGLESCWNLTNDCIIKVVGNCPNIKHLNLSNIYCIKDPTISIIARNCQKIQFLGINGCWRVTNESIIMLREYAKFLQRLDVADCRSVNEISLARLRIKGVSVNVPKPNETNIYRRPYEDLFKPLYLQI